MIVRSTDYIKSLVNEIIKLPNEKGMKKIFFIQQKNKNDSWIKFMAEDVKGIQKDVESNSYAIYLK